MTTSPVTKFLMGKMTKKRGGGCSPVGPLSTLLLCLLLFTSLLQAAVIRNHDNRYSRA